MCEKLAQLAEEQNCQLAMKFKGSSGHIEEVIFASSRPNGCNIYTEDGTHQGENMDSQPSFGNIDNPNVENGINVTRVRNEPGETGGSIPELIGPDENGNPTEIEELNFICCKKVPKNP